MKKTECSSTLLGERYLRYDHKSGLPIYVFPKKMTTSYALFSTRYGSIHNRYQTEDGTEVIQPAGMAHFLEHKLFENEDGSDAFAAFSDLGADANAYTSYLHTAYLFSCTDRFEEALGELIRFVTHPHFTDASVQKEQGIIAEEIRMYEDLPGEKCHRNLLSALYHIHPVQENICGSEASIAQITPELLYRACRLFYQPHNMALVLCGDFDADQVAYAAARELDRWIPSGERARLLPVDEPDDIRTDYITCRAQVAKPMFSIGIKDPVILSDPKARLRRDAALELLDEVLFSRSGVFYNTLFEEGLITPGFYAGYSCTDSFAYHCISGESDHPLQVKERLLSYLEQVQREGIDPAVLERCRRVLYADEIRAYDSTEEIANRLLSFVFDDADIFSYPALIQEITKEELDALLRTCYQPKYLALSVVYPGEEGKE